MFSIYVQGQMYNKKKNFIFSQVFFTKWDILSGEETMPGAGRPVQSIRPKIQRKVNIHILIGWFRQTE
jgi:hypothetical protein